MTTIRFSIPSASADANTNANKYIEKSKLMEKLSNLDRWLRENGSEMNEKCEFGFSSASDDEDNKNVEVLVRKNTRGIFSRRTSTPPILMTWQLKRTT